MQKGQERIIEVVPCQLGSFVKVEMIFEHSIIVLMNDN